MTRAFWHHYTLSMLTSIRCISLCPLPFACSLQVTFHEYLTQGHFGHGVIHKHAALLWMWRLSRSTTPLYPRKLFRVIWQKNSNLSILTVICRKWCHCVFSADLAEWIYPGKTNETTLHCTARCCTMLYYSGLCCIIPNCHISYSIWSYHIHWGSVYFLSTPTHTVIVGHSGARASVLKLTKTCWLLHENRLFIVIFWIH